MLRDMLEEKWTRTFGDEGRGGPSTEAAGGSLVMTAGRKDNSNVCSVALDQQEKQGRAFEVLVPKTRGGLMVQFDAQVRRGQSRVRRLIVQSLGEGSRALQQGILQVGDDVREINGLPVAGKFYEDVLRDITRDKDDHVLLTVFRKGLDPDECRAIDKQGTSFVVRTRELVSQHSWDRLLHDV